MKRGSRTKDNSKSVCCLPLFVQEHDGKISRAAVQTEAEAASLSDCEQHEHFLMMAISYPSSKRCDGRLWLFYTVTLS